ncbi:MAG: D-glycero-beta-D-manno-heptose 1-phosphate adenylyltransferase [Candidatus Gorgyraea atricola]|nr:D-glycero-beta-D-manno-heptose 1-phosphate adenylyltransferase [Candidatus Gorgyraea atricola]
MLCNKIKNLPEVIKALKKSKGKKRIVFTNGCFDILHVGHVAYLQKARSLGDILVVGLNSDSSVRKLKGRKRPVNAQKNRAKVLSALACVDFIVIFNSLTPLNLIKAIKPKILVKGGDWKAKDIVGGDFVQSLGGLVKSLPYIKGFSTRKLIKKIRSS